MKVLFSLLFASLAMTQQAFSNEVAQMLDERIRSANSLLCVGLDPDPRKMPKSIMETDLSVEEKIESFLIQVIDITAPHVCAFKAQKAFFDRLDEGHALLRRICSYVHNQYPKIPFFIDCKIGDIDNTMEAYVEMLYEDIGADAVVINPYMGDDVFIPFLQDPKKAALVLVQTSNPQAKVVQELILSNGKMLWEEILNLTLSRWNKNKNLFLVLSSNSSCNYEAIRKKIPQETPILLAGVGSQGGNPKILRQLLNRDGRGVFVNSSRSILYPYSPEETQWRHYVLQSAVELKQALNTIREKTE